MSDDKIKIGIIGLRCFNCKSVIPGGLTVPAPLGTNQVAKVLIALKVLAVCEDCLESNPAYEPSQGHEEKTLI